MQFTRLRKVAMLAESVLRCPGVGPQSGKVQEALYNSLTFHKFEVQGSLAFIILKG